MEAINNSAQKKTWDYDGMIDRMLHDVSIAEVIISHFLQDIPYQIETLKQYIEKCDMQQIKEYSHSIKGSASIVGADAMCALLSAIEQKAIEGGIDEIHALQAQLTNNFIDLDLLLNNYLKVLKEDS